MSDRRLENSESILNKFVLILAFGKVSLLEIESVISRSELLVSLKDADDRCALIETDTKTALALIRRLGGSYKLAKFLGYSMREAIDALSLPFESKFYWTLSGYNCAQDLYEETQGALHELLKGKGLGKSKFLHPEFQFSSENQKKMISSAEIKAEQVQDKILLNGQHTNNPGIDLNIHGGVTNGKPIFTQTIETFDWKGFEERDFGRPFQDPTKTLSPRIARMVVNLSLTHYSTTLLDPFCGLGTVLQEALLCGISVVGIDRDQRSLSQAKANLQWVCSKYQIEPNLHWKVFADDARRISHAQMPRIDAIATEPILLPVFKDNPRVSESKEMIERARAIYQRSFAEFALILAKNGGRLVVTTPMLIDASGKRVTFDIAEVAKEAGFKLYFGENNGKFTKDLEYPLLIPSSKRKKVHRTVSVFYLE
jgi:tRNA G10  N-methylase Trm11